MLAAAVEAARGAVLMEAGCGVGAALFCAAALAPDTRFVGIEREAAMAALARENAILNGVSARVTIEDGDALARGPTFDGVFFNPPFDAADAAQAPHPARAHAYLSERSIADWIKALADRLKGGAALTLVHRAERTGEIVSALEGRLGGVEIFPVRPRAEQPAKRVLVRARKGSRAPMALLRGLDLHDGSGAKYTPEADAILKGEAAIRWGA
jgi:tRNA1(Val) A37 N6-methylase TrmN6